MWKNKFIPHIKKPIFILVEWEAEEEFFNSLKIKFRLWNIEIYKKSKEFFKNIKEANKSWFFNLIWKPKQESKYQDKWNIVYIIFDLKDEEQFQKLDILKNNIEKFGKNKFIKWEKDIKWKIDYFYSNPCFEKLLLVLNVEKNCLENVNCKNLKQKVYWKNRTDLNKIGNIISKLWKKDIIKQINDYIQKCNLKDEKDLLFLIKNLLNYGKDN